MSKLIMITLSLATWIAAHASPGDGLWMQMRNGSAQRIKAKVTGLEVSESGIRVQFQAVDGTSNSEISLCSESGTESQPSFRTEELRAGLHNERVSILREAIRSAQIVELGVQGPWSPCLSSILLSTNK